MLVIERFVERRRREKRIPCDHVMVRITADGSLTTVEGYVVDVSNSGLKLRTDNYFRTGVRVAVEMNGLLIRGTIRYRCVQKTDSESFAIGIKIEAPAYFSEPS
jgi:PilZ domain